MGAERIIAMSRHASRQNLAREYGATDIVAERGAEGSRASRISPAGVGADAVLECVGTQESMQQAIGAARPGGNLIDPVWNRKVDLGKVFDLTLPLEQVAEGYRAMDARGE